MTGGGGRFDTAAAELWRATDVPSWTYRWALPAGWILAFAASVFGDDAPCSVEDPTVCGADATFSLAMIACFGALLAQWRVPRLGWLLGVVFGVLDLLYDDVTEARVAWTCFGVACLLLLLWSERSRSHQHQISRGVRRVRVRGDEPRPVGVTWRVLAAAVVAVLGAGGLGVMHLLDAREADHLVRADERTGTVSAVTDDGDIEIELADGSRRTVTPLDTYVVGDGVRVLVDPTDAGWTRLPAEPADNTYWYTIAGCAWLAALVLLAEDRRRRAAAGRGPDLEGIPVRVAVDDNGRLAVFPVDDPDEQRPIGLLQVEVDDPELDQALEHSWESEDEDEWLDHPGGEEPDPDDAVVAEFLSRYDGEAVLVGELVEGSGRSWSAPPVRCARRVRCEPSGPARCAGREVGTAVGTVNGSPRRPRCLHRRLPVTDGTRTRSRRQLPFHTCRGWHGSSRRWVSGSGLSSSRRSPRRPSCGGCQRTRRSHGGSCCCWQACWAAGCTKVSRTCVPDSSLIATDCSSAVPSPSAPLPGATLLACRCAGSR